MVPLMIDPDTDPPSAFVAPSLTPIVAGRASTNPGVRIYSLLQEDSYLLDYDQGMITFLFTEAWEHHFGQSGSFSLPFL